MSKGVSFSVDDEDYPDLLAYAKHKGLTVSGLAKMALYQYRERYPLSIHGKPRNRVRAVQPHHAKSTETEGADQ